MRESQTRPGPIHGVFDQPCAHWIAEHVAEDGKEMAVLLDRKTFEATLPHMSMAPVMAMVTADVARHPPLHKRAEGRVGGRLHDQMKMIGHEAEAEDPDGVRRFCGGEQVEEYSVVAVLVEDCGTAVSAVQYMVGISGHLSAWNPRHRSARYAKLDPGCKKK